MQPHGLVLRRVALSVLLLCSIVAIMVMGSTARADEETAGELVGGTAARALENELQAEAEAIESRDAKISIYSKYVKVNGVSAEIHDGEVFVPAVAFAEAMDDCSVSFGSGMLTIEAEGLKFEAKVGDMYVVSNGRYFFVENGVSIREDGQIWLSLTTMAKIFGCEYTLDVDSKSAYLTPTGEYLEDGATYYNAQDLYWLSRIINAESRGEPFMGQIAVGTVVMNRVKSTIYPNTVHGVVFDGAQFSPAVSGSVNNAPLEQCVTVAKIILEGYRLSDKIMYFYAMPANSTYRNGFVNTEEEIVIGNHYFYTYYKR